MGTGEKRGNKNTKSLAKPPQLTKIKLNDGKEYQLIPVDVNILSDIEDKLDKPFYELFTSGRVKPLRYMLYLRLKDQYPEIDSEEKLGSLMDINVIYDIGEMLGVK